MQGNDADSVGCLLFAGIMTVGIGMVGVFGWTGLIVVGVFFLAIAVWVLAS